MFLFLYSLLILIMILVDIDSNVASLHVSNHIESCILLLGKTFVI